MELHRPATHADIVQSETPGKNLPLGRNEAAMTLESLLHATHGRRPIQAINVTDGIAFSWRRLLRNAVNNKEIIGEGISAVYAVKALDDDIPKLLLRHPNSSYTHVFFWQQGITKKCFVESVLILWPRVFYNYPKLMEILSSDFYRLRTSVNYWGSSCRHLLAVVVVLFFHFFHI